MQESRNSFFRRFEVHANFQHFRSESYAQALQNMSALSPLSYSGSKLQSEQFFSQQSDYALSASATALSQSFTRSAPTSPKRVLELQKSSTLPSGTLTGITFPNPKKSSSSSLLSFLKKLSPKARRSKDKLTEKPWIVVEFSQNEIEGNTACDNISIRSDQSFELAARSKDNYFESLNCSRLENSVSDDESLRKNGSGTSLGSNLKSKPSSRSSESSIFSKLSGRKSLQDMCSATKVSGSRSNKYRKNMKLHLHKQRPATKSYHVDGCNYKDETSVKSTSQESTEGRRIHYVKGKVKQSTKRLSPDPSLDSSENHDVLGSIMSRAQPPQTLSLVSSVFVRKACVEELSKKMASAESIGACSLDVDRSESSTVPRHEEYSASACSLKSASMILSNGSKAEDEQKSTPDGKAMQRQEEVSSLKVPSYLGISCAISGYKNYSRFCHSRDNSPARLGENNSHATSILKPSTLDSKSGVEAGTDGSYRSQYQKTYFTSSNGISSKQTFISSQEIMIRGKSPGRETASLTNGFSHKNGTSKGHGLANGHADSVDACEPKSLVQQRIESLFGQSNISVPKMHTSRSATKALDEGVLSARSPSCPPQASRSHSRSPPVFRHITRDFRNQLQHSSPVKPANHVTSRHPFVKASSHPLDSTPKKDSASHLEPVTMKSVTSDVKNVAAGHAFLRKLQEEKDRISDHIQKVQDDLAEGGLSEEMSGRLLSAVGKANLLITQKFEQFRGLCEKNIKQDRSEPFPTTSEDLAGFWDMVMLQVNDVNKIFEEIGHLRANSWKETVPYQTSPVHSKNKKISKPLPSSKSPSKNSTQAAKAREAQRQKLMEAKNRGRQQRKAPNEEDIEIFVADKPE